MCSIKKLLLVLWQNNNVATQIRIMQDAQVHYRLQITCMSTTISHNATFWILLSTWCGKLALKWENINTVFICPYGHCKIFSPQHRLSHQYVCSIRSFFYHKSFTWIHNDHAYKMTTLHRLLFSEKYQCTLAHCTVKWWSPFVRYQEKLFFYIIYGTCCLEF